MKAFLSALANSMRSLESHCIIRPPQGSPPPQEEDLEGQGQGSSLGWLCRRLSDFLSPVFGSLPLTSCKGVGHSTRKPQCSLHLEMPSSVWVGLVNQLILLKEILHIHVGCLYWPALCQACLWRAVRMCKESHFIWVPELSNLASFP